MLNHRLAAGNSQRLPNYPGHGIRVGLWWHEAQAQPANGEAPELRLGGASRIAKDARRREGRELPHHAWADPASLVA